MSLFVYMILLFFLVISLLINGGSSVINYLLFYLAFSTTSLVLSSLDANPEATIKSILYIDVVYLVTYFLAIRDGFLSSSNYAVAQMGVAYSFVPFAIICFVFIVENVKNRTASGIVILFSFVLFMSNVYVILIDTITRGAILAVFAGMFVLLYLNSNKRIRRKILIVFSIAILIFCFFSTEIVDAFFVFFQDTSVGAISKLIKFSDSGDVSNGRDDLYISAIKMIKNSCFLGNGVGYFENHGHSIYVHQFFLQLLCEAGILGMLLFIFPLFQFVKKIVTAPANSFANIYIAYFCFIMTMLMFSNVYWFVPTFWLLYFYSWNAKV